MSAHAVFGGSAWSEALARVDDQNAPRAAIAACAVLSFLFGCAPLLVNLSVESILYVFIMLAEVAIFLRDDPSRSVFASVAGTRSKRRVWTIVPLVLSVWVLLVQDKRVALPTLTLVLATMLWTLPEVEKRNTGAEKMKRRGSGDDEWVEIRLARMKI